MTGASASRKALRASQLEKLGPQPPWWKPFERRQWTRRYRGIMAIDVSEAAELFARIYTPESIAEMAHRPIGMLKR